MLLGIILIYLTIVFMLVAVISSTKSRDHAWNQTIKLQNNTIIYDFNSKETKRSVKSLENTII